MKLILGSKSPRRKELLSSLGYTFEVRTKETDESFPSSLPFSEVAQFIAEKKTEALISELSTDEVLLCADTVVVLGQKILGKPQDREEAIRMLKELSGKEHLVISGVVIASKVQKVSFSVCTSVFFHTLSDEQIEYYVDTFKPYDKAGSYGIQEWIGYIAIKEIQGSYNNVVGLPTFEVYEALKQLPINN